MPAPRTPLRHVAFVGAMGSGKTTIGSRVAAALDRPFLDNDALLEASVGMSAADLESRDGLEALHRVEASLLLEALAGDPASVIAAAASTIEVADVRTALRARGWVVWLRADPDTLIARVAGSPTRPLGNRDPATLVREQSRRRDALFAEVADATFQTARVNRDDVVKKVVDASAEGCLPQYDP